MPSISVLLLNVYENEYGLNMNLNFSKPRIYTGGVDITKWSALSVKQQKEALQKHWYVYYSFRNPATGNLTKQSQIKAGANRFKDKQSRYHILKKMREAVFIILREGYNPYRNNTTLKEYLENRLSGEKNTLPSRKAPVEITTLENSITIIEAFEIGLKTKERVLAEGSFTRFKSRIKRFEKWLLANDYKLKDYIIKIDKKTVIHYLNIVLQNSSPRNRNNTRTDLGSLFQTLEDNDLIKKNFIKKINVLNAVPKRNKTYTPEQLSEIDDYLRQHDPLLRLFIQFVSYNFLRPIEVCRLTVADVDLKDKKIYVKAKNKPVKIKIIPDILIQELPDLSHSEKTDSLFTVDGLAGVWKTSVENKRDYFSKKFKKVKDHFRLGTEYGLYSFRHTFITKLYREMVKDATPFEVKSKLKLITGHATMNALELYLRDIDAELPQDYSQLLK